MKIVLAVVGSLGDLHPYLAIAQGLKARGHEAIVATSACYRQKVEALGLGFRSLRPDSDCVNDPVVMERFMHLRWGTMRCLRDFILPVLRESYADTLAAADGADLLVSHPLAYSARLVSEKYGIPWVSTLISPTCLMSAFDPPLMPGFPEISKVLRPLGPWFWGPLGAFLKWVSRSWAWPWYRLRKELGLPPAPGNPLVDGHSPGLVLALFSRILADKQRDWPKQIVLTGFPFHDEGSEASFPPKLARFLEAGPPPVVFTLGVSAATVAGRFFEESVTAALGHGQRAVLVGKWFGRGGGELPEGVIACEYVPFAPLFRRAAAVVHAGGIGSSGLAMRAGRPMLVVPFAHDQPDNAERLRRLGIARTIPGRRYTVGRVGPALRELIHDAAYAERAAEVETRIRQENGVAAACDALERL
jgi:UDP:flavonoid glycosyltransferase YjiC (YdhE family)